MHQGIPMADPAMNETDELTLFDSDSSRGPSGLGSLVIVARHHGLHLSVPQLIHDNVLTSQEVTVPELLKCAASTDLKARSVTLDWNGLAQLKKALPAIVRLTSGGSMVLLRLEGDGEADRVVLQDPNAASDALLVIDRIRFEDVWTGEVILIKRNYDLSDEKQPFSFRLVLALLLRERPLVRDAAICALALGFLGLTPIVFMRLVSGYVINYR